MGWFWVVGGTWLLLALVIALLIGRTIREDDDPQAKTDPPSEKAPRLDVPQAR
jgi:hypothetical protein